MGVDVPEMHLLPCSPPDRAITGEAEMLDSDSGKPSAEGLQPLLASWVDERVKNGAPCLQIPNPVSHCFTEQEAKQLAWMSDCNKKKGSSGKDAARGNSLPDL